jgi:hypothetical protein
MAAIYRLQQSSDPGVRRLAKVLHKYRWVVYWAAEGPDIVQNERGYHSSHWFPLYSVNYEHPERFDLTVAQPYYDALLRHAYRSDYGAAPDDVARHGLALARQPRPEWREVALAFACGYTTHLISDYFCHAPAKVWWDHEPKLKKAVREICHEDEYGVIQEFYAVMLWERYAKTYGLPDDAVADFRRHLAVHHVDNGILPYCALAASKRYYADWPERVLKAVDPAKYDACAAHLLHRAGKGAGDCVGYESKRVHAMLDHIGMPFDRAVQTSNELTHWQDTYDRVVRMIVALWTHAAPQIGLAEPDDVNVVLVDQENRGRRPARIVVPSEQGTRVSLAPQCDMASARFRTRKGVDGPVTQWGQKPSGARFDVGMVTIDGRRKVAILTDGPYLLGAGQVRGSFRLRLPQGHKITFRAACGQQLENTQKSDGVTFRVLVVDRDHHERRLFDQHVCRQWCPVVTDLTALAGQEIDLVLVADSGPRDDFGWDMGAWIEPVVMVE